MQLENDIEIRLSSQQIVPVKAWVERFCRHQKLMRCTPAVETDLLKIHAGDIPDLLSYYANVEELNELDVYRLKKEALTQIESLVNTKRSPEVIDYFKFCYKQVSDSQPVRNTSKIIVPQQPNQPLEFVP